MIGLVRSEALTGDPMERLAASKEAIIVTLCSWWGVRVIGMGVHVDRVGISV